MAAAAAVAAGRRRIALMKETLTKQVETNINEVSDYIRTGDIDDPRVYSKACMRLGRSIDSAIAMNAFPSPVHLPKLIMNVKEVYRRKTELMQPSLMLLMLPIKAACQVGWFPDGDKDGFLMMVKEVSYGFSSTDKMNIEPSNGHSTVSNIVSRFYPTMKVERILTSFDVKAGYGTFVADFHISFGTTPRNCRNLWLLVAQLDNMETAACITSPLNVDFLINGCGVPNRTKNNMGKGPQLPAEISKMIKYGVNLLQVFGDFDGQYFIALAFMNSISSPDPSQLQAFLRPMSDCAVIEMSSRITLYCPISQHRIKTPVKGHLCKHPQCFEYNDYIEVNSIKPTWKCPLCNNPVCNQDIRIDQDFLKILNDVPKDVDAVIISEDGSWMVAETDMGTVSQATVTPPVVFLGQSQVVVCTTTQAQSTTVTPPVVSPGQTPAVTVCTTQGQSTSVFTPPAVVPGNIYTTLQVKSEMMLTPAVVSAGQTPVNACTTTQPQSTSLLTPPAVSPVNGYTTSQVQSDTMLPPARSSDQIRVNVCTTTQAQITSVLTPPTVSPGNVYATTHAKSETALTPPAGSSDQIQSNFCTTWAQSTSVFTPHSVFPGNVYTATQAKSETMLTPPAGSLDQIQVNICASNQTQSITQPATVTTPIVSPVQSRVNVCPSNQAQSTSMFTKPATVTVPAVSPVPSRLNVCTTTQAKSTTTFAPPAHSFAPAFNEPRKGGPQSSYDKPGESQPAPNISQVSPTQLPEASGDAIPSGRMRGSLKGDRLQAARLRYLAQPQQPARANEPWSRPPIPSLPMAFMLPQTHTNSDRV